jgi:rhamnosyltransferase
MHISIAMGTYNGERFLKQQLDSFAAQSLLPAELVVCDDGSSDRTIDILKEFAAQAPFLVRIHRNETNLGYRANFLKCAARCRGDLIAFSDQDDVWRPYKLAEQVEHFNNPAVLLSGHRAALIDGDGQQLPGTLSQLPVGTLTSAKVWPFSFCAGFTQMFRRELLGYRELWNHSVDIGNKPMAHDQFFIFLAFTLGAVYYDPVILADYRQHDSNTYGAPKLVGGLNAKLANRFEEFDALAKGSLSREIILNLIATGNPSREIIRAAREYALLTRRMKQRRSIYAPDSSRSAKAVQVARLALEGSYRLKNPWRFTLAGLLRDTLEIAR